MKISNAILHFFTNKILNLLLKLWLMVIIIIFLILISLIIPISQQQLIFKRLTVILKIFE